MFTIIGERFKAASLSTENLCPSCGHYSAKKYALDDSEIKLCTANLSAGERLKGPVSTCTDYYDKSAMSVHSMKEIAWTIESSKKKVGFGEILMEIEINAPKKKKDPLDDY